MAFINQGFNENHVDVKIIKIISAVAKSFLPILHSSS